jgi:hypothetical protein
VLRFTALASVGACLALALMAGTAHAGTMTLYSCHTPSGRIVPTHGWQLLGAPEQGSGDDRCANDGTLFVTVREGLYWQRWWSIVAAPDTTFASFAIGVCGRTGADTSVAIYRKDVTGYTEPIRSAINGGTMGCIGGSPWCCGDDNVVRGGPGVAEIWALARCGNSCPGTKPTLEVSTFRADVTDSAPPAASNLRGALASSTTQRGREELVFDATDVGVGVFRAVAEARIGGDWREIVSAPVESGGACTPVRETGYLYEFSAPRPCPLSVSGATLALEPGALPAGSHDLRVRLEDAAGNGTLLFERVYTVLPQAVPVPGRLSLSGPSNRRLRSAGPYRLSGLLVNEAGQPIANGVVAIETRDFLPRPRTPVGGWVAAGSTTTNASGRFQARVPGGASRSVRLTYNGRSIQADLTVAAQVSLRAKRTRVRNGESVVFTGRVKGPLPQGGVLMGLEARDGKRWTSVPTTRRLVRTSRTGAFRLSYRFRRTFRPTTFRFRAVAAGDSGFRYGTGASRTIAVHVRP